MNGRPTPYGHFNRGLAHDDKKVYFQIYLLAEFISTYTCARSPMISTVGVFIPLYFERFGNSSRSPKLTRPGDL